MPLFRVSVKRAAQCGGVRIEAGMSVDISTVSLSNPLTSNGGVEVNNAFLRIYGLDLKRAGMLSMVYLDVQKR